MNCGCVVRSIAMASVVVLMISTPIWDDDPFHFSSDNFKMAVTFINHVGCYS